MGYGNYEPPCFAVHACFGPTPKLEVTWAPYGTFRLFMPPLVPKIKTTRVTSSLWLG